VHIEKVQEAKKLKRFVSTLKRLRVVDCDFLPTIANPYIAPQILTQCGACERWLA
jgi:hypothetical protein